MKSKDSTEALQQVFFKEKTRYEIIEERIKTTLFGVLNILLKFEDDSFASEVLSLINETCQFLFYSFYDPMGYIWRKDELFQILKKFFAYFQTIVFFNNSQLYIVFFYVICMLIVLVVVDIIYVSYIISSKNKAGAVWPMRLLRSIVSFIVTVLFGPWVEYLLAVWECSDVDEEGNAWGYYQNYNVDDLHCWENTHFTVLCVLSVVFTIVFVTICTVVQTIFYETKTSEDTDGAKTGSKADLVNWVIKIILIMIYSFWVWSKDLHWIVVPATTWCGGVLFYVYWVERPFYEERMNMAFFIHTGIFFWSSICLWFLKALETAEFDGGIFVFLIGWPIIVFIIYTQKDDRFGLLLTNINKFAEGESIVKQIRYFLELVDQKNKVRTSNILLEGYIYVHEEYCTSLDCPLKKYLKESEKREKSSSSIGWNGTQTGGYCMESVNNLHPSNTILTGTKLENGTTWLNNSVFGSQSTDNDIYLFQYAMQMYQNGISKFPSCTTLRMNYAFFLMERMKNNKKSLIELKNCEKFDPTFEQEFIIFRFTQNETDNDDNEEDDESLDIVSNIAYRNYYNSFKEGWVNTTKIYIEFWTLLLNQSKKSEDNLIKMNEYGEKINKLIGEIKTNYDEMEKLKYNDVEVLGLYSDFFLDIWNDKQQAMYYRNRLQDVQGNAVECNDDKNAINEIQGIPESDEYDYIFLSAEGNGNIGTIIKISLGVCSLFGYSPSDLIGKNINYIMPDMYQDVHQKILSNKWNKFKTQMTNNRSTKDSVKPAFKEVFSFGKNKLKYAVPLAMKVTLMHTQDQNELFFASRIINDDWYNEINAKTPMVGVPPVINFNMKICYVLTDPQFIVQFYTPNAINFLGFKSNTNGNMDITKSINDVNNNEDRHEAGKVQTKSESFKRRYWEPKIIIWRTIWNEEDEQVFHLESTTDNLNMKGLMNYSRNILLNSSTLKNKTTSSQKNWKNTQFGRIKRQKFKEDFFLLSVTEIQLLNSSVGYVFRFEAFEMEKNDADMFDDKNYEESPWWANMQEENNQAEIDFCPTYIPEINRKFKLDTKKLAFVPTSRDKEKSKKDESNDDEDNGDDSVNKSNSRDKGKDWHLKLREFANEKINKYKEQFIKKNETISESSYSESYSDDESSYSSDDSNSEDESTEQVYSSHANIRDKVPSGKNKEEEIVFNKQNSVESNDLNPMLSTPLNKNNEKTATKVNGASIINATNINRKRNGMTLIRKSTVLDNSKSEFNYYHVSSISKIKFSIYDFKKEKLVDVPKIKRESQVEYKKKEQIPGFVTSKKQTAKEMAMFNNADFSSKSDESQVEEEVEDEQVNGILVKQIEYALRKEEFQPEIIKLQWISFLTYTSLIVICSVYFTILLSQISSSKENLEVISNHHNWTSIVIEGFYYIRELVLWNNDKYENTLFDKDDAYLNITNSLEELFKRAYVLQQKILTTTMEMTGDRDNIFNDGETTVTILHDTKTTQEINLSLNTALSQVFISLYQIRNLDLKDIFALNTPVFFYIRNAFNPIIPSIFSNWNNFINELHFQIVGFKQIHWIILIVYIIILWGAGVAVIIMYELVIQRKSSYWEVFFEIEDNVCKTALNKCDSYANLIQPLQNDAHESVDEEDDPINQNTKLTNKSVQNSNKKQNKKQTKNDINLYFVGKIVVVLTLLIGYFITIILTFHSNWNTLEVYSNLYNTTYHQSHTYLGTFDKLREFFFDRNNIIESRPVENSINDILENIYVVSHKEQATFDVDKLPSTFSKIYRNIMSNSLCDYTGDWFTNSSSGNQLVKKGLECGELVNNNSDFGINIMISYYTEMMRDAKNDFEFTYLLSGSAYNNTLVGYEDNNYPADMVDALAIFNEERTFILNVIRRFYLKPTYEFMLKEFYTSILSFWKWCNTLYVGWMVALIVILTLSYFGTWKPFENQLDQDIYKTKNMLSIIPKEVLASLNNIDNLLNLGNSLKVSESKKEKV